MQGNMDCTKRIRRIGYEAAEARDGLISAQEALRTKKYRKRDKGGVTY